MLPPDAMSPGWQELNSSERIEALMYRFGNFHDSCIREVHAETSHYVTDDLSMHFDASPTVHILIQRQFRAPSAVELRFAEIIGFRLSPPPPNHDAIIFGVAFFARDGVIYWAEDGRWTPECDGADNCTWVVGRRAWWRDVSGWMGPALRYLTGVTPSPTSSES